MPAEVPRFCIKLAANTDCHQCGPGCRLSVWLEIASVTIAATCVVCRLRTTNVLTPFSEMSSASPGVAEPASALARQDFNHAISNTTLRFKQNDTRRCTSVFRGIGVAVQWSATPENPRAWQLSSQTHPCVRSCRKALATSCPAPPLRSLTPSCQCPAKIAAIRFTAANSGCGTEGPLMAPAAAVDSGN